MSGCSQIYTGFDEVSSISSNLIEYQLNLNFFCLTHSASFLRWTLFPCVNWTCWSKMSQCFRINAALNEILIFIAKLKAFHRNFRIPSSIEYSFSSSFLKSGLSYVKIYLEYIFKSSTPSVHLGNPIQFVPHFEIFPHKILFIGNIFILNLRGVDTAFYRPWILIGSIAVRSYL